MLIKALKTFSDGVISMHEGAIANVPDTKAQLFIAEMYAIEYTGDGADIDLSNYAKLEDLEGLADKEELKGYEKKTPFYNKIEDYPSYIYNQDYFDDLLENKTGAMLRTDTCVPNQFCFGVSDADNGKYPPFKALGFAETDDFNAKGDYGWNSVTRYKYFYWADVEENEGEYDFSTIENYLKDCYNIGARAGLRLFVNSGSGVGAGTVAQDHKVYTINGVVYRSWCPQYIVEKMANSESPQYYYQNDYIITDFNNAEIVTAYKNLITACGEWLDTATFTINNETVAYKDLVAYIDMGTFGAWGEGAWYDWRASKSKEDAIADLLTISATFVEAFSDTQINMGQWFSPYKDTDSADNKKNALVKNGLAIATKTLGNNVGKVGFFLDNIGTNNQLYKTDYYINERHDNFIAEAEKWGKRGDFFTGEFALFGNSGSFWGYEQGLYALKSFKLFNASHFRFHNMTDSVGNGEHVNIAENERKTWIDLTRALACVGGRYVVEPLTVTGNVIKYSITNIGLRTAFFDFYNVKIRVRNLDNDSEYTDLDTSVKLTEIEPKSEPLLFTNANGYIFTTSLSNISYTNYTVSIIGIDKMGFRPMFFSNYDRNTDGSYLLFTKNNGTYTRVTQNVYTPDELTNKVANKVAKNRVEVLGDYVEKIASFATDIEYTENTETWTKAYAQKAFKNDGKLYSYINPSSSKVFVKDCKECDKFIAKAANNQLPSSNRPALIFFDKYNNVVGTFRFTSNGGAAEGEEVIAPIGSVKVYYQCLNNNETMSDNKVTHKTATIKRASFDVPSPTELSTILANTTVLTELQTKKADSTENYIIKLKDCLTNENNYIAIANGKLIVIREAQIPATTES